MFPTDSVNVRLDMVGNGTSTLVSSLPSDSTILYESFNTSSHTANASLQISCFPSPLLLRVNDFSNVSNVERFKSGVCPAGTDLAFAVYGTTGSPITTVSVVYVPRDRSVTPDPYPFATSTNALSAPLSTDIFFATVILIAILALSGMDFIRRLFASRT